MPITITEVPINATRICDAIARIGYEPHSALMDIVDNSVAADALSIRIFVNLVDGKTINQRNNVQSYTVVDNGNGMAQNDVLKAFQLGSEANYSKNSLSKYGMGLKSAGLSLGSKIQVVSKKNGVYSERCFIDRAVIEQHKKYVVCSEPLTDVDIAKYDGFLEGAESGTIVEITGCGKIYHASAKSTIDKLKNRLGVTYYPFLRQSKDPLKIHVESPAGRIDIDPLDILFSDQASDGFDATEYDGSVPCIAHSEDWQLPGTDPGTVEPVKLRVVTFPQAAMGDASSPLPEEKKEIVRSYRVARENKGFFVYRNGRLIRWGDELDGIIGKDLIGFRGAIELTTAHDDLLHVDVSKQRLEMDDEIHRQLNQLMRSPKQQAKALFEKCGELLKKGAPEGIGFSQTVDAVPEDDPGEELTPPDSKKKKERARKKIEESEQIKKQTEPEAIPPQEESGESTPVFNKIRYSDAVPGTNLWIAQKHPIHGVYVTINRRHGFYSSVLANWDEAAPERLACEAMIFCLAIAEVKTFENVTSVDESTLKAVIDRFLSVNSYNLNEWSAGNQQLFEV